MSAREPVSRGRKAVPFWAVSSITACLIIVWWANFTLIHVREEFHELALLVHFIIPVAAAYLSIRLLVEAARSKTGAVETTVSTILLVGAVLTMVAILL